MKIDTPLGKMAAVFKNGLLCELQFTDSPALSENDAGCFLRDELDRYFNGECKQFKTLYTFTRGTPFQRKVWEELAKIPYGETISYAELARRIGKPTAYRAVAQANSVNPLAILVPCHRVINTGGKLGGYAGGLDRKRRLLEREGICNILE